jgi:hypothetical protein
MVEEGKSRSTPAGATLARWAPKHVEKDVESRFTRIYTIDRALKISRRTHVLVMSACITSIMCNQFLKQKQASFSDIISCLSMRPYRQKSTRSHSISSKQVVLHADA